MKTITSRILSLPRKSKKLITIINDVVLCFLCTWLAFIIRFEEIVSITNLNLYIVLISVMIFIPIFWLFGSYQTIIRFAASYVNNTFLKCILLYGFLYFIIINVLGIQDIPKSIGVIQPMLLFFAIVFSRMVAKFILTGNFNLKKNPNKKNVLIYGAGIAGRQLALALENSNEFQLEGFLDDSSELHNQNILSKNIYSPRNLGKLIKIKEINLIFLAIPSIGRNKRNQIIENLNKHKLTVKTLPSISEVVDGRIKISDIRDFNVEDLLDREEVKPNMRLMNKNINLKNVLVTGAGGSIGSELCRQIIKLNPNKLILIESNEYALYKLYDKLLSINKNIEIIPLLANATEQLKLEKIFEIFKVDTVYHTAAYKHVPLVEENICEGIKNNVFSTIAVTEASVLKKVSNLVLISSDKAVRPTNIMGVSKRISELYMQAVYHFYKDISTNLSIVRFGNVLESSGSVIPKFKKQINQGGPVTLTHNEVTRYFMTVTEAAQLVIQAGAMGKKSEVFILDMGKEVKIRDLIYQMIKLSGLTVKDSENPYGDIKIKITGIRPGEKLYEELLIGNNPKKTFHEKIKMAEEPFIPYDKLKIYLKDLNFFLEDNKIIDVIDLISKLVPSYQPNPKNLDHINNEQLNFKKNKQFNT